MGARITDFIRREKDEEVVAVQGYVPAELREQVVAQMSADKKAGFKITWDLFMEAACRAYLEERGAKKRG